jgi:multidrug efflux system outer membrane protein
MVRALYIVVVALVGCGRLPAVGPDFVPPTPRVGPAWEQAESAGLVSAGVLDVAGWWRSFGDPALEALVHRAAAGNGELERAESRVREARALRRIARGDLYPQIGSGAEYARVDPSDTARDRGPAGSTALRSTYEVGFDAAWEVDIFGGNRRASEAAEGDLGAARADHRAVLVSLVAETVREYFAVRTFARRVAIARRAESTQVESLGVVEARFAAGLSSELDVAQARTELERTRARVPLLELAAATARYRLGVLLGEAPAEVSARLAATAPQDGGSADTVGWRVPDLTVVDTPSELLRRRPDIERAERELGAATARIGVAVADLFPRFDLGAAFGFASGATSTLFDRPSRVWSVVPGVRWPVFNGGALLGAVEVATERERQALSLYGETVLRALAECEVAFVAYREERRRIAALEVALAASRRALELSRELYTRGLADLLRVIAAERTTFDSEDELARSEETLAGAVVAIYKAVGGDPLPERHGGESNPGSGE